MFLRVFFVADLQERDALLLIMAIFLFFYCLHMLHALLRLAVAILVSSSDSNDERLFFQNGVWRENKVPCHLTVLPPQLHAVQHRAVIYCCYNWLLYLYCFVYKTHFVVLNHHFEVCYICFSVRFDDSLKSSLLSLAQWTNLLVNVEMPMPACASLFRFFFCCLLFLFFSFFFLLQSFIHLFSHLPYPRGLGVPIIQSAHLPGPQTFQKVGTFLNPDSFLAVPFGASKW